MCKKPTESQALPATMKVLSSVVVVAWLATASCTCEPWCTNPCTDLNGAVDIECADCGEDHACRPGAPGFVGEHVRSTTLQASGAQNTPVDMEDEADGIYSGHNRPIQQPEGYYDSFVTGACDLQTVDHTEVTREMLTGSKVPFMIKGLTKDWAAHSRWGKKDFLRLYGDEPFQLHAANNASVQKLLKWNGKYHMGHAVYPPKSCYSDPWRPYSPMLLGALRDDYALPSYLGPMTTFQMGVGSGYGIGVPPENHPSSWFAVVKGRKRWVLMPPEAGTSRSGGPGSEPPGVMQRYGDELCKPDSKPLTALHCDQEEGDVIWVPDFWWHETCGLDDFSIGLGALTYDTCVRRSPLARRPTSSDAHMWYTASPTSPLSPPTYCLVPRVLWQCPERQLDQSFQCAVQHLDRKGTDYSVDDSTHIAVATTAFQYHVFTLPAAYFPA